MAPENASLPEPQPPAAADAGWNRRAKIGALVGGALVLLGAIIWWRCAQNGQAQDPDTNLPADDHTSAALQRVGP